MAHKVRRPRRDAIADYEEWAQHRLQEAADQALIL